MFALTETQSRIDVQHIEAAAAWIRHAVASVRYVFVGADEEAQAEKLTEMVRKLLEFLKQRGSATRREITVECFSRRETKLRIDAAVEHLLGMTPPRIYVQIIDRPLGTPGTPTTVYRAV
nr:hypothetical protein [uncultured Albidiferax sp.]